AREAPDERADLGAHHREVGAGAGVDEKVELLRPAFRRDAAEDAQVGIGVEDALGISLPNPVGIRRDLDALDQFGHVSPTSRRIRRLLEPPILGRYAL